MNKRRIKTPNEAAKHLILVLLLIIGGSILGGMMFEVLLGVPPTFIQAVAIVILVVIGVWFKENI